MSPYVFALLPERKHQDKLTGFIADHSETKDAPISCIPITTVPRLDDVTADEERLLGIADRCYATVILDANISLSRDGLLVARIMGTPKLQDLRSGMITDGDKAEDDACRFELIVGRIHSNGYSAYDMPLRDFRKEFLGNVIRCDGVAFCETDATGVPIKIICKRKLQCH